MARKRHSAEQIIHKLREAEIVTDQVRVKVRNLHLLRERLLSHSLGRIKESDTPFHTEGEEESFVSSVEVNSK